MAFKKALSDEKIKIEKRVEDFFNHFTQEGTFNNKFLYQFYDDLKNYLLRGGKRLRPVSLVMIYKGLGGKDEGIYDLAISVELLHNASLVHDDIIDHDEIRRGEPSFHAFYDQWFQKNMGKASDQPDFGLAMGILGGDLLIDLGQEAILHSNFNQNKKLKALTYYLTAYRQLIDGVAAESYLQNLPLEKVSELDYLDMIKGKTSALFEKSLLMGAVAADEEEKFKKDISEFAILLGQSFQIRDDILGVFGNPEKTGKSVDGDIREGKKTLLAIYGNKESRILNLYGKKGITEKEIQVVRDSLKDSGALENAKKKTIQLSENASKILGKIRLSDLTINFFKELIEFVQERID
jgi:geranylgeranyl diphosphate synthase type I